MEKKLESFLCLDCEDGAVPNSSSPTGASECMTCDGTGRVAEDPRSDKQKAKDKERVRAK